MKLLLKLSLLCIWCSAVIAAKSGDSLYRGCLAWVGKYTFECPSEYYKTKAGHTAKCQCWSPEFIATYVDCISRATHGNTKYSLHSFLSDECAVPTIRPDLTVQDLLDIYENATDYFVDVSTIKNKTLPSYHPIKFTQAQVDQAFRSFAAGFYSKYTGNLYGGLLLAYFGAVMLLAAISNFLKKVAPGFVHKTTNNSVALFFRRKLINPALFGYKHSVPAKWGPFNMALPTRAQTWVLAGYFAMYIIFIFIKYDIYDGNTRYTTRTLQISRYVGDRAGLIAMAQLPLIYAFAGRNNILMFLTGLSYDTMSVYHRWVARVMYLNVFIHAVTFSINYRKGGTYFKEMKEPAVVWGIAATVCISFTLVTSLRHFREHLYEVFLLLHQAFAIFFTVGVWWHVKPHKFSEWIYCATALWAFDRAARLARIVLNGVNAKAHLELHPQNLIKIQVDYNSFVWRPRPGAYAFVQFLSPVWRCWETHPFTAYPSPTPGEEKKLVFCARVRKGKTKQLEDYLVKNNNSKTVSVLIDGPYGHAMPLHTSETIVIICGGIGFTGGYSYASKLGHQAEKKSITFIWAIQNHENVETFRDELEYMYKSNINVQIYLSSEPNGAQNKVKIEKEAGSDNEKDMSSGSAISFNTQFSRPDLKSIVSSAVSEASGSIGFLVCGPAGMNDDVRKYVSENMGQGKGRVDLYIEAFNW